MLKECERRGEENLHAVKEIGIFSIPLWRTNVIVRDNGKIIQRVAPYVGDLTSGSVKSTLSPYSSQQGSSGATY